MGRVLAVLMLVSAGLAVAIGGAQPFGRVLMSVGLHGVAARVFQDPHWRGVAHYRGGDMEGAAASFRAAKAFYNLGNTEVHRGRHAAALEAYDIDRMRGHADASANFDIVSAYYAGLAIDADAPLSWVTTRDADGPVVKGPVAQGSARAAGQGADTTNAGSLLGLPELTTWAETSGVRRVFDDKFVVANDRWLATLEDVPGSYLNARIKHEFKRRHKEGLTPPNPEDPR